MAERVTRGPGPMTPAAEVVSDLIPRPVEGLDDEIRARRERWIEKHLRPECEAEVLRDYGVARRLIEDEVDENLLPAEAHEWCRRAHEGASMILAGPPGTGKTTTAVWCLRRLYRARISRGEGAPRARLAKVGELFRAVFDKDRALLARCEDADVLVLDDWGTAHESDWPLAELDALIDRRWEALRPTIVTTNLNPEPIEGVEATARNLRDMLPRSYDRLNGQPGPGVVILDRPSLRRRGQG